MPSDVIFNFVIKWTELLKFEGLRFLGEPTSKSEAIYTIIIIIYVEIWLSSNQKIFSYTDSAWVKISQKVLWGYFLTRTV